MKPGAGDTITSALLHRRPYNTSREPKNTGASRHGRSGAACRQSGTFQKLHKSFPRIGVTVSIHVCAG